jgi:hypothetical protein
LLPSAERGLKPPELALWIACAVFADPVWLIGRLTDILRSGFDAAGVVSVGIIDCYNGHAGDYADGAR